MGIRSTQIRRRGAIRLLALALLAVAAVLVCGRWTQKNQAKLVTNEDRLAYLAQMGWTAEEIPVAEQVVQLPKEFPPVLEQYNTLQIQQGFDLKVYRGKEVTMYTYRLLEYPSPPQQGDVYACLYVYPFSSCRSSITWSISAS